MRKSTKSSSLTSSSVWLTRTNLGSEVIILSQFLTSTPIFPFWTQSELPGFYWLGVIFNKTIVTNFPEKRGEEGGSAKQAKQVHLWPRRPPPNIPRNGLHRIVVLISPSSVNVIDTHWSLLAHSNIHLLLWELPFFGLDKCYQGWNLSWDNHTTEAD